ncbi:MAG: FmdB family transcriptional regulator [Candidatus Eremiobacteraeota bacterium]|nr:FmdB family transcriptional regulator [Candidatus Eremiobacteraeota bacterium]
MPLYDYACPQCDRVYEVRHGFGESCDKACEACGAPLRRVFNPAPVLFKGSGFYVTDSRRSSAAKTEKPKEEAAPAKPAKGDAPAPSAEKSTPKASEPAA